MTPEELQHLKDELRIAIADQIKITVNGKIDRINYKLDAYIEEDNAWKERAKPVIEMGNNARGASVVLLWLAGTVIAISGAYTIIRDLLKK